MCLLKAAHPLLYEIRLSFDSGCLVDSALQHQTHLVLSCIGPRIDRSRLVAGTAAWELADDVENSDWHSSISRFYPSALRAEGVLSSPPSVCLSVCPSVRLSVRNALVYAITRHRFQLGSPNWHQLCILGKVRLLSKMGVIDVDLQGHFGLKLINFHKFEPGHTITHQECKLESLY